MLQIKQLIVCW